MTIAKSDNEIQINTKTKDKLFFCMSWGKALQIILSLLRQWVSTCIKCDPQETKYLY